MNVRLIIPMLSLFAIVNSTASAQEMTSNAQPRVLADIGIEQRLNEQLPLDLMFKDSEGREVRLGDYFRDRPVVLSLVYYECPMLCTMILNGLLKCVNVLEFDIGNEFEIVTVSFDPTETPAMAAQKKASYLAQYDREGAEAGWHFLTGTEENIKTLTQAAGFNYKYDADRKQYVHASGIMVATPDGKLSRYAYGIEYSPRDLKLSLIEASAHKIGSPVDAVLLYCFHYDPTTGKYGLVIMNVVRLIGTATVVLLAAFIIVSIVRDRRAKKQVRTT